MVEDLMPNPADGGNNLVNSILEAFRLREEEKRGCSFAFSSRSVPSGWRAYTFEAPLSFYLVEAPGGNLTQIKALANGIGKDYFVLLASMDKHAVLVLRRYKKDDNAPLAVVLRKEEDFERVISTVRKYDFLSEELTAHSSLISVVDSLKAGAERYFTNRGLFSNHFLKERLSGCLSERGRSPPKEATALLAEFGGELPTDPGNAVKILESLGYSVEIFSASGYPEYMLRSHGRQLDACCVVAGVESLDIKTGERVAPSYQAVAALRRCGWVVLTNGRLWRLFSSRVSSPSTNYFEVDLDGIVDETDPRLVYFVSLFASSSFALRDNTTDLDLVFDGSISHAQDVENDLKRKVFDEDLFLNLIKAVIDFSPAKMYEQEELDRAKGLALKLLYRLLFVLYAESRELLPVKNSKYKDYSFELLRPRLNAFEKVPEQQSVWVILTTLSRMISKGDAEANLPQYNGALFEEDLALDGILAKNKFVVPALRGLMEFDGKGIDYQNLGVRHLGSLYEALLEYSVRQAKHPLVIYKEEIMDAKYAEDLKQKPVAFVDQGELYLSAKGLTRKGTGSYYTPDEIVNFLVKKSLEPHFKAREEQFRLHFQRLPAASKPRDFQFIQFFQTNDPRVIEKYLGRPKGRKIYPGLSVVRKNIRSGKAACFSYSNTVNVDPKTGLMELLGHLDLNKESGSVILHHESMHCCEERETPREITEGREQNFVVDDLCECHIEESQDHGQGILDRLTNTSLQGQAGEGVIEHAHKSGSLATQPDEQERKQES